MIGPDSIMPQHGTTTDIYFLELVGLQGLLTHTTGCDVEMISIMMPDADIAVSAGDPVAAVCLYQCFTYGF
jgi:hypothetical protein